MAEGLDQSVQIRALAQLDTLQDVATRSDLNRCFASNMAASVPLQRRPSVKCDATPKQEMLKYGLTTTPSAFEKCLELVEWGLNAIGGLPGQATRLPLRTRCLGGGRGSGRVKLDPAD